MNGKLEIAFLIRTVTVTAHPHTHTSTDTHPHTERGEDVCKYVRPVCAVASP